MLWNGRICDRCRRALRVDTRGQTLARGYWGDDGHVVHLPPLDLCDHCSETFESFMTAYKHE